MPMYRAGTPINFDSFNEGLSALGKAFAPPSAQESYLAAKTLKERQELENQQAGLAAIRGGNGAIADFIGAGVSDPVKAYAIADMYGRSKQPGARPQDLDASSFAVHGNVGNTFAGLEVNNRAQMARTQVDQQGLLVRAMVAPVAAGATRFNPPSISSAFGVAPVQTGVVELNQGQQATLPDGRVLAGAPKPLSMDEAQVPVFQRLSPELQAAKVFGNTPTPTVSTPDGLRITTAPESLGQAPAPDAAAKPQLMDYLTPDGRAGTGRFDPVQGYVDTQTGAKLPQGIRTLQRTVQAATEDGLGSST